MLEVRVTSSDETVTRLLKGWGVVRGHRTYACGMGDTWEMIVVVVAVVVVVW